MRAAVVIATYNEAGSIEAILDALRGFDVFVVDDNSPDGTAALAQKYTNVRVLVRPDKLGIASAYRAGFCAALFGTTVYEAIVQMDAGGTHPPECVEALLDALEDGADLAIGSRFVHGRAWRGYRTGISLGAAWLMRRLGVPVQDATSGFRAWRAAWLCRALTDMHASGFAFQLETLWSAHRAGARIVEVPIPYALTNSSFRAGMVGEALRVWARLAKETWL